MREVSLLNNAKITDNKLRWDAKIGDAQFELYIPKWRVPDPWPGRIFVHIQDNPELAKPWLAELKKQRPAREHPEQPIISRVNRYKEHTRTVRFNPIGDQKSWEIGSPYIPYELLDNEKAETLVLRIIWDRETEWSSTP